jgi:hypothetical protein
MDGSLIEMNWDGERQYEGWRAMTLAVFIIFIGFHLLSLSREDIPLSFLFGAAAALCGFLLIGNAWRPPILPLAAVAWRYWAVPILFVAAIALLWFGVGRPLSAPLFIIACIFFGREARGRVLADGKPEPR